MNIMTSKHTSGITKHCARIGDIILGEDYPVRIQSMTDTPTLNVEKTVKQCIRAFEAGADLMRIGVPDFLSVEAFRKIKKELQRAGFNKPLIADIHFSPKLALAVAPYADKIRINPGNYLNIKKTDTQDRDLFASELMHALKPLTDVCLDHGTAIRIGTNSASLPQHMVELHGRGAVAMAEATALYLNVFERLNFHNLVISLKASSPRLMMESQILMKERMLKQGKSYPMHIGVTEAGEGINGRMKSALGIITLLQQGIGNTIRVSLTEPPEYEIAFAKKLLHFFNPVSKKESFSNHHKKRIDKQTYSETDTDILIIKLVRDFGQVLLEGRIDEPSVGMPNLQNSNLKNRLINQLLQASGRKQTDTEFISCPSCARTSFDMTPLLKTLKAEFSGMPGLKIALMGCVVNGPGEMEDADYGLLCSSKGKVHLYKGHQLLYSDLSPSLATNKLKEIIKTDKKTT